MKKFDLIFDGGKDKKYTCKCCIWYINDKYVAIVDSNNEFNINHAKSYRFNQKKRINDYIMQILYSYINNGYACVFKNIKISDNK